MLEVCPDDDSTVSLLSNEPTVAVLAQSKFDIIPPMPNRGYSSRSVETGAWGGGLTF